MTTIDAAYAAYNAILEALSQKKYLLGWEYNLHLSQLEHEESIEIYEDYVEYISGKVGRLTRYLNTRDHALRVSRLDDMPEWLKTIINLLNNYAYVGDTTLNLRAAEHIIRSYKTGKEKITDEEAHRVRKAAGYLSEVYDENLLVDFLYWLGEDALAETPEEKENAERNYHEMLSDIQQIITDYEDAREGIF